MCLILETLIFPCSHHARPAPLTTDVKRSSDDGLWHDLCVPPEELRPASTLTIGQCFNWRQAGADCWVGVLGREIIAIRYRGACSYGHRNVTTRSTWEKRLAFTLRLQRIVLCTVGFYVCICAPYPRHYFRFLLPWSSCSLGQADRSADIVPRPAPPYCRLSHR